MSPRLGIHQNSSHSSPLPPLTEGQLLVLKLLLEGHTVTAAAEQAGIHRTTIHHWCRTKPEFVHALDAARQNRQAHLHEEMDRLAVSAVAILEKTLTDESAPAALRLKAALSVLQALTRVSSRKPLLPRSAMENIEIENFLRTMENEIVASQASLELGNTAREKPGETESQVSQQPQSRNSSCPSGSGLKYKRCCGVHAPPLIRTA